MWSLSSSNEISGLLALLLLALFAFADDKPSEVKGRNGIVLPPPPYTEGKTVTENIHGTTLTDPYRWLEDGKSPATRAWIDEQMKYTEQWLPAYLRGDDFLWNKRPTRCKAAARLGKVPLL
jgi:Prolyl oligopeptidase, N-terminal beta-propeller domain